MDDKDVSEAVDYINVMVKNQGATCTSVKDGHIFVFKKSFLKDLLDKQLTDDNIVIFIQKPKFEN